MVNRKLIPINLIKATEVIGRQDPVCACGAEVELQFDLDGIRVQTFLCKEGWNIVQNEGFLEVKQETTGEENEEDFSNRN